MSPGAPLQRRQDQLALLVDSVADYAIFMLEPDGRVATWNRGAERIKGYTADEIVGRHFSAFYTEEDRANGHPAEILADAVAQGSAKEERWRVRSDGTRFWADVLITPVRDESGELVGFAKVTRDLTERRAAEQELQSFASSAAHDMQEPLRTVSGFVDLLLRRHRDELVPEAQEYLDHIHTSVERMSALVASLLAYARAGSQAIEPEDVALLPAAEEAVANLEAALTERGVAVALHVPADASVLADHAGVVLVLQNLLANAARFADAADPRVSVEAEPARGGWALAVCDNGPGVPPEKAREIFDPFVQLSADGKRGSGLGLSIAQRIVERHQGAIDVGTAPGGGACFRAVWPGAPVPPD